MASLLSSQHQFLLLSAFPGRNSGRSCIPHRSNFGFLSKSPSPSLLRGSFVARLGSSPHLPDFETADRLAWELFGRFEGLIYTVADAATQSSKQSGDWLSGITNYLEAVLKVGMPKII